MEYEVLFHSERKGEPGELPFARRQNPKKPFLPGTV